MLNVPSSPMRPSLAAVPVRYRNTSESSTRSSVIARRVPRKRGSVGEMNFTIGIRRFEASTVVTPLCCTNVLRSRSKKVDMMSW